MDRWVTNKNSKHRKGSPGNKPDDAVDMCFNGDGSVLYAGGDAWDGILNNKQKGPCTNAFPVYSTARIASGGNIKGNIFKCALKPVEQALVDGTYKDIVFTDTQQELLKMIFPTGVCDYTKPDVGKPQ